MSVVSVPCFEVRARTLLGHEHVLRRFEREEDAVAHALNADMAAWEDVWVASSLMTKKDEPPTAAPPFPWNVQWVGGYAYIIDANGKKIASLLGSQKQREFVAEIICGLLK